MKIQGINIKDSKVAESIVTGLLRSAGARHMLQFVLLLEVAQERQMTSTPLVMAGIISRMIANAPKCYNTLEGSIIIYTAWRFVNFDSEFIERLISLTDSTFNAETIKTVIKRAKRANADLADLERATAGLVALEITS